jgi:drug/metabolite transporter (DMT)-like permease
MITARYNACAGCYPSIKQIIARLSLRSPRGVTFVTISAIAFGCMPIFAIYAYADGVDPGTLLFLRFLTAALFMLLVMRVKKIAFPRGASLIGLVGMGAVGYFGQSLCYFYALTLASAGLVALLLYLYPAFVTGLSALILKQRITRIKALALLLSLMGAFLVIGPDWQGQPLGIGLGIGAALIYSLYILTGSKILKNVPVFPSSAVIMISAGGAFAVLAAFRGVHLPQTMTGWTAILGLTVVSTILAILTFMAGLEIVGPANAALLSTLEPVVSVILAVLLLGETLTIHKVIGGTLILTAVLVLTRWGDAQTSHQHPPAMSTGAMLE